MWAWEWPEYVVCVCAEGAMNQFTYVENIPIGPVWKLHMWIMELSLDARGEKKNVSVNATQPNRK